MRELPGDVLRTLIDGARDLVYCCDAAGCFTYANPVAAELMGYSPDEVLGRHYLALIAETHRGEAERFYGRQFVQQVSNTYFEFPAQTRGGAALWLGQHVQLVRAGDGRVDGFQAIARDITRQRLAESRLKESEEAYRSLVDGAAYGIYRTNGRGAFTYANPALVAMLGYPSLDELLALPDTTSLYRDPEVRTRLINDARAKGRITGVDVEWKRKDGSPLLLRLSGRTVWRDDAFDGFEVVVEDVTEQRRMEQQRAHLQRVEAVVQLAGGIAHHINNALMGIAGFAELLLLRHQQDLTDREDLQEILRASERGATITRQLLTFSQQEVRSAGLVDLNEVVGAAESMLLAVVGKGVAFQCDVASQPATVALDARDAQTILAGLVTNARDAMPKGGRIGVRVAVTDAGTVELRVVDGGAGMSEATRSRVFEPFFTTKRQDQGTGLGLPVIYGIVHRAGGTIDIESQTGIGTTVTIRLPLARPAGTGDSTDDHSHLET